MSRRPVYIPGPEGDLFGVFDEPTAPSNGLTLLVFVGGGRIPCSHRNGMWTRLADDAAAAGYHVLRVDWHGIGESAGHVPYMDINQPFQGDVLAAVDWLKHQGLGRVITVGSCFGGRTQLVAAPDIEGLEGMALVVPPVAESNADRHAHRSVRWFIQQALRGDVVKGMFEKKKRDNYVRMLRAKARSLGKKLGLVKSAPGRPRGFAGQVGAVLERGIPVLMTHGTADVYTRDLAPMLDGSFGDIIARSDGLMTQTYIEGKVHGFATLESQQATIDVINRWLAERAAAPQRTAVPVAGRVLTHAGGQTTTASMIGPEGSKLFVTLDLPAGDAKGVVVICSSILMEALKNGRREVLLARRLAAEGYAVARFHYRGTRSSDSDILDVSIPTMTDDIISVTEHALATAGVADVAFVATRLAALAVAPAAAKWPDAPLVLWDPATSGARYFKELLRSLLMKEMKRTDGSVTAATLRERYEADGFLEANGFPIGWRLNESAEELSLGPDLAVGGRRVALFQLTRSDAVKGEAAKLVDAWRAEGGDVRAEPVPYIEAWWFNQDGYDPKDGQALREAFIDKTVEELSAWR